MSKKRRKLERRAQHTPLAAHKKVGSKLLAPLSSLPFRSLDWARDLLPEHLLIAALIEHFGLDRFHKSYNELIDVLDTAWPHEDHVCLGLVSDFGEIPHDRREHLLKEHEHVLHDLFFVPAGRLLSFYPESPVHWLCLPQWVDESGPLDPAVELPRLRSLVAQLLPGRNAFSSRARIIPLVRVLKHGKIFFREGQELPKLLPRYPLQLNEDETKRVESGVRALMHTFLGPRLDAFKSQWSSYFWRKNYDLVPCHTLEMAVSGEGAVGGAYVATLQKRLVANAKAARSYLDILSNKLHIDLYDPTRDEVLFGLFSRMTRLYCATLDDPFLWARDISGIILRCLAETAIVFGYLAKCGTAKEFADFVAYGEGQQKLLMLHLQDNYPDGTSLEGMDKNAISEQLGGFHPELLDIELGHWTKKDNRHLAKEANLQRIYRLVFTPASGDVHGTWWSIRNSNLAVCAEPLHRFHWRPQFAEPPFYVNTVVNAQDILHECVAIAIGTLNYPPYPELQPIEPPAAPSGTARGERA